MWFLVFLGIGWFVAGKVADSKKPNGEKTFGAKSLDLVGMVVGLLGLAFVVMVVWGAIMTIIG